MTSKDHVSPSVFLLLLTLVLGSVLALRPAGAQEHQSWVANGVPITSALDLGTDPAMQNVEQFEEPPSLQSAYLVELPANGLTEEDPMIADGTISDVQVKDNLCRCFVRVDLWPEFSQRFPEAYRTAEFELPPSAPGETAGSAGDDGGSPRGPCSTVYIDGNDYEDSEGDVDPSPTWPGEGVRLSAGGWPWEYGWTQYRWYLPLGADGFTQLRVSGYLKDTSDYGDGPQIRVYNWQTQAWDSQLAGKPLAWYQITCQTQIGIHISSPYRNVLFRVDANWDDDTDLKEVKAYYCTNETPIAEAGGPYSGIVGQTITFDTGGSSDPDGDDLEFRWDWDNNGTWDTPWLPAQFWQRQWMSAYHGVIVLQARDGGGLTDTDTATIDVYSPPVAEANGPYSGAVGQAITFSGAGSYDPDGSVTHYRWDWTNDGTWDTSWSTSSTATHAYTSSYHGLVKLQVKDNNGYTDDDTAPVDVSAPPVAEANGPYSGVVDEVIEFDTVGSYDPDGEALEFRWDWDNNGSWDTPWLPARWWQRQWTSEYHGNVVLQARDEGGLTDTDTAWVDVGDGNEPPVADAGGPYSGVPGQSTCFNASGSYDPDGTIIGYRWDFNFDSTWDTGWEPSATKCHTYASEYHSYILVEVQDDQGARCTDAARVDITPGPLAPVAEAGGPYGGAIGQEITFDASGSYDPNGDSLEFRWDWDNNGTWDTPWLPALYWNRVYPSAYHGYAVLAARDPGGLVDTDTAWVDVPITCPPVADAGGPYTGTTEQNITVSAAGSHDPDGGNITGYRWDWTNDGTWDTGWLPSPSTSHTYADPFQGNLKVEVKDDEGATAQDTASVTITVGYGVVNGTVRDSSTGAPISGATVALTGQSSKQTNSQGQFSFTGVPAGQKELIVSKPPLYYSQTKSVSVAAGSTTSIDVLLISAGGPVVTVAQITSRFCDPNNHAYYLNGVPLNETFTATVDWQGHPAGSVEFRTPQGTVLGSGSGDTWTCTFNVGSDFGTGGHLQVVAVPGDGAPASPVCTANFDIINPPSVISASSLVADTSGPDLKYVIADDSCTMAPLDEAVQPSDIPSGIPFFGGDDISFKAMGFLTGSVNDDGTVTTTVSPSAAMSSVELGPVEFEPTLDGTVTWRLVGGVWETVERAVTIGVTGSAGFTAYVWYVPPVYFEVNAGVDAEITVVATGWMMSEPGGTFAFQGHIAPWIEGVVGVGIDGFISVEGYARGGVYADLLAPPAPTNCLGVLEEVGLFVTAGARGELFFAELFDLSETWTWSLCGGRAELVSRTGHDRPRMMSRNHLKAKDYAAYVLNSSILGGGRDQVTTERSVQESVFPRSDPHLAALGDDLLLAWVHDDPSRTPVNFARIDYVKGEYQEALEPWPWTWSVLPLPVHDDGTADFDPFLAAMPDGTAFLAWENASEVLAEPQDPNDPDQVEAKLEELKSKMEICLATHDGDNWGTPTRMTTNNYLDRSPQISVADDGKALLVWISNTANDQIGTAQNPNEISYCLYDGAAWSSPAPAAAGVSSVVKYTVAYGGTNATILYVADLDDNQDTVDDRELFGITYDGTAWSAVARLTTDSVEDATPQARYDSNGNLLLVWYSGGNILMQATDLAAWNPCMVVDRQGAPALGAADFRLTTGGSGNIALIWQAASKERVDIWAALYDPNHQVWTAPKQITTDAEGRMEYNMAAVYTALGDLLVAYDKVDVNYETQLVEIGEVLKEIQVPVFGDADLYLLRHIVTGDVAVCNEDVSMTPANPTPGQAATITATIRNVGDTAQQNVEVAFYDGHPMQGGTLFATVAIPDLLLGGTATQVNVNWAVPPSSESHDLYVVAQAQDDGWPNNNTAVLTGVVRPDLSVSSLSVQEVGLSRVFTVRVMNTSGLPADNVGVTLRRDAVDGPVLATLSIPESITPGAYYDSSWMWEDLPACRVDVSVYAIVDNDDAIAEFDEANNTRLAVVNIGDPFTMYDLNGDDFPSIVGDVPPFVDCVYFEDCHCPGRGCVCPGDCNGDGFLSIVGDVPCFVDCVYFEECAEPRGDKRSENPPGTFTIGGAVYADLAYPMTSGLEQVSIRCIPILEGDPEPKPVSIKMGAVSSRPELTPPEDPTRPAEPPVVTTATGALGLWRIDAVSPGTYRVTASAPGYRITHVTQGSATPQSYAIIVVSPDNAPVNQSIQFLATEKDKSRL